MKRLTGRAPDGTAYLYTVSRTDDTIDKLAAYEDTGMEPEEISTRRWIPVTERLPEPLVNVLALYGDGRMDIDWVDHEGCFVYENLYDGVTHCPACDNEFAQHRRKCKFVPGMGGDRHYCKCPVCGAECKTRTKEETQR